VKGVHSLGCVGCGERESWWIGTIVGVELGFGDVVWRVDNQRVGSPC
jgi:hypothetical protein